MSKSKAVDVHKITREVYQFVIDDVIEGVREDFEREGVDESILMELKKIWERRLATSGAVPGYIPSTGEIPIDQQITTPHAVATTEHYQQPETYHHHHQQQHYEQYHHHHQQQHQPQATQQQQQQQHQHYQDHYASPYSYSTPQLSHDGDAAPALTSEHQQQPELTGMQNTFLNFQQSIQSPLTPQNHIPITPKNESFGRPQEFMPPVHNSYNSSLHAHENNLTLPKIVLDTGAQEPNRQYHLRQRDEYDNSQQPSTKRARYGDEQQEQQQHIPQYDGSSDALSAMARLGDDDEFGDDDDEEEDVSADEQADELNSDDDVNDDDNETSPDTNNIILTQYEKVNRTKNKWKCQLKYGIMHLNGRDYLFHSASGDFEW